MLVVQEIAFCTCDKKLKNREFETVKNNYSEQIGILRKSKVIPSSWVKMHPPYSWVLYDLTEGLASRTASGKKKPCSITKIMDLSLIYWTNGLVNPLISK